MRGQQGHPPRRPAVLYGRVFFILRQRFGLGLGSCLLADVVHTLARRTGWCYASREYLASIFDTSVRSIQRDLAELERLDLIERSGRKLRTTALWQEVTGRDR